jgi:hypothetical protein
VSLDNQRLREDLARKSKSLQDALTALAVAMETASFRPAPVTTTHETILVGSASTVSGRDLASLQNICNRLSETIKEKDDLIGVLRKQCIGLGKRVIELEAGTLPDFSEKGLAAAEEAEATERQKGTAAEAAEKEERQQEENARRRRSTHATSTPAPLHPGASPSSATSFSSDPPLPVHSPLSPALHQPDAYPLGVSQKISIPCGYSWDSWIL